MAGIYLLLHLIGIITHTSIDPTHASESVNVKLCDTSLLKLRGFKRFKAQILHNTLISGVFEE